VIRVECRVNLTAKQKEALAKIKGGAAHFLIYGGSRSGKTFLFCFLVWVRAIRFPGSRHLICRLHYNHVKASIWLDTLKAIDAFFPGLKPTWNETDHYIKFSNGSEIWVDGLDDKERVEKILGREYATIYYNECSQIGYSSVQLTLTRLAQKIAGCKPRAFYDLNPTSRGHWTYKLFVEHVDPIEDAPLKYPQEYAFVQMNPKDNTENLAAGYIETQLEGLSESRRRRFLDGEYSDDNEALVFPLPKTSLYRWEAFTEWVERVGKANVRLTAGLDLGFEDADGFVIIAYAITENPMRWLMFEHKARRQGVAELAIEVRKGIAYAGELGLPHGEITIYSDTGGGGKKSVNDLYYVYGLPVEPAYKADKDTAIELLRDDITGGRFMVPLDSAFAHECERTVWRRDDDSDQVIRKIDDAAYHPDLADAILYAMRPVWYWFSQNKQ